MALLVTNAGQEWIVDLIHDTTDAGVRAAGAWEWGAWGTNGVAETVADVALGAESAEARVEAVTSQPTADTIRSVFTITSLSTQTIREVGLFNQSTPAGSICLMRGTFPELNLEAEDRIEFTLDNLVKSDTEA